MSNYETDYFEDTEGEDLEEDVEDDDDAVLLGRLAQLEAENGRLRRQLGTRPPPKPVGDINTPIASAQSREQVLEAIAQHNAALAATQPEPEPLEIDHDEVKAEIAATNSPEEVLAILTRHGMPNSGDGLQNYR